MSVLSQRIRTWYHKEPADTRLMGLILLPDTDSCGALCTAIATAVPPGITCVASSYCNIDMSLANKGMTIVPRKTVPTCDLYIITGLPASHELHYAKHARCRVLVISACGEKFTAVIDGYNILAQAHERHVYDPFPIQTKSPPLPHQQPPVVTAAVDSGLAFITCPVCYNLTEPPWQACTNGHVVCGVCYVGLPRPKKCPTCRVSVDVLASQRLVEEVLKHFKCDLKLPCKNEGCDASVPWEALPAHHSVCDHRSYRCPIGIIDGKCAWTGRVAGMATHFKDGHARTATLAETPTHILLHNSNVKSETYWHIPHLNILAGIVSGDPPEVLSLPSRRIWFFSLTAAAVRLRLSCECEEMDFSMATTLTAPSVLEHENELTAGVLYLVERRISSNVSLPLFEGDDVVTLCVALCETKRKRADADADDDVITPDAIDQPREKKPRHQERIDIVSDAEEEEKGGGDVLARALFSDDADDAV